MPQIEIGSDLSRVGSPSHLGGVDFAAIEGLIVCIKVFRKQPEPLNYIIGAVEAPIQHSRIDIAHWIDSVSENVCVCRNES